MYIKRHMEEAINKMKSMFGAVMLAGPRQVGKTTLLKKMTAGVTYVTLDDPLLRLAANDEPGTFFKATPPPVFVDEIQYAPNLFPYIKIILDNDKKKGQFYLSGSQQFRMMRNASESLAGRIGILNLLGLSLREINNVKFSLPFLPTDDYFSKRRIDLIENDYHEIWRIIHRGSMPELYADTDLDWQMFYASYTKTYMERDVHELAQVGDRVKFTRFLTALAGHTGQLLNQASIARDVGVSQPTIDRWISVLRASNIVYLLEPYYNNVTKRAIKTPKIYFLDTGLAAYLTRWHTPEALRNGAMAGAFFETFVIAEIIKSYHNAGIIEPPLYFYRDKEQNEIDLLIYQDMALHPIEIKKHADPSKDDVAFFRLLDKIPGARRAPGGVVCMCDHLVPLKDGDMAIPLKFI